MVFTLTQFYLVKWNSKLEPQKTFMTFVSQLKRRNEHKCKNCPIRCTISFNVSSQSFWQEVLLPSWLQKFVELSLLLLWTYLEFFNPNLGATQILNTLNSHSKIGGCDKQRINHRSYLGAQRIASASLTSSVDFLMLQCLMSSLIVLRFKLQADPNRSTLPIHVISTTTKQLQLLFTLSLGFR